MGNNGVSVNGKRISIGNILTILSFLIIGIVNYVSKPSIADVKQMIIEYSSSKTDAMEVSTNVKAMKDQMDRLDKTLDKISEKIDKLNGK
jgi:predicted  nucleic acid-binding Zn-ribbon protein